jgi:hypothetical protein
MRGKQRKPAKRSFADVTRPRGVPYALQHCTEYQRKQLHSFANGTRGLYGLPVYLCGSALKWGMAEPRDWDIRLQMPDAEFLRRFGDPKDWASEGHTGKWTAVRWRWSDECVKQAAVGSRHTGLNIDFQIYPMSHCRAHYKRARRYRLDTRRRLPNGTVSPPPSSGGG